MGLAHRQASVNPTWIQWGNFAKVVMETAGRNEHSTVVWRGLCQASHGDGVGITG